MPRSKNFTFDGGAATYFGMSLLALFLTCITLGIAYPWALCMKERWRCHHTFVQGRRLKFLGGGAGLLGQWIKWFFLMLITAGIYSFWVVPALNRWVTEHTDFADA
jgi:uncharacterized membrane protein YjgN (DUF898 family)